MLFSIVIPVHNGEKYIDECVSSVLAQEDTLYGPSKDLLEVIIVENGSSDNTPAMADEYAKKYPFIKTIHRGKIGLFAARQEGFLEAAGDWILSLDADDKLDKGAIKELCLRVSQTINGWDEADLVIFRAKRDGGSGKGGVIPACKFEDNKVYMGPEKEAFYRQFCMDDSLNSMWTKCIKRSIATMEHDAFINNGEDLYQTCKYLERARGIAFVDRTLYLYSVGNPSMTSTYDKLYLDNQKVVWGAMDEFLDKLRNDTFREWVSSRKSLTCAIFVGKIIYSGIGHGKKKEALKSLMQDEFYKEYAHKDLPDWAPEQSVFVHDLMTGSNPMGKLLRNALKFDIKTFVKRALR